VCGWQVRQLLIAKRSGILPDVAIPTECADKPCPALAKTGRRVQAFNGGLGHLGHLGRLGPILRVMKNARWQGSRDPAAPSSPSRGTDKLATRNRSITPLGEGPFTSTPVVMLPSVRQTRPGACLDLG
jgi:hypothetical protein